MGEGKHLQDIDHAHVLLEMLIVDGNAGVFDVEVAGDLPQDGGLECGCLVIVFDEEILLEDDSSRMN